MTQGVQWSVFANLYILSKKKISENWIFAPECTSWEDLKFYKTMTTNQSS